MSEQQLTGKRAGERVDGRLSGHLCHRATCRSCRSDKEKARVDYIIYIKRIKEKRKTKLAVGV